MSQDLSVQEPQQYYVFANDWELVDVGIHATRELALKAAYKKCGNDFRALIDEVDAEELHDRLTDCLTGSAKELIDQNQACFGIINECDSITVGETHITLRIKKEDFDYYKDAIKWVTSVEIQNES